MRKKGTIIVLLCLTLLGARVFAVETPPDGKYVIDYGIDIVCSYHIGQRDMRPIGYVSEDFYDITLKVDKGVFVLKMDTDFNGKFDMVETWHGEAYVMKGNAWQYLYYSEGEEFAHLATFVYDPTYGYDGGYVLHVRQDGWDVSSEDALWYTFPMRPRTY